MPAYLLPLNVSQQKDRLPIVVRFVIACHVVDTGKVDTPAFYTELPKSYVLSLLVALYLSSIICHGSYFAAF